MAWSKDNSVAAKLAAAEALAQAQRAELAAESVDDAIAEVDVVVAENTTRFLNAVATVALRDSTYPTPLNGDTVRVTGTSTTYRYSTGSGWVVTDVYNATAIDNVTAQLAEKAKQTDLVLKADKTYVDTVTQSIASGSPKGTYTTLAALQAAFPTGNTNIYLVLGNVKEVASLNITAIPTVAGNVTVTLNGVAVNIAIDPTVETTTTLVATKIRNATYSGWTTSGTGTNIIFTATVAGIKTDATFSVGSTGATGSISTTTQGVDADGKWYYWNGTAWISGGVYQSTGLANGTVTKDKMDSELLGKIYQINNVPLSWEVGSFDSVGGLSETTNTRIRVNERLFLRKGSIINIANGANFRMGIFLFNYNTGVFISQTGWQYSNYTLTDDFQVAINFSYLNNSPITDFSVANTVTIEEPFNSNDMAKDIHTLKDAVFNNMEVSHLPFTPKVPVSTHISYANQDGTLVENEIWMFQEGLSNHNDATLPTIRVLNKDTLAIGNYISHNLGHANGVDYRNTKLLVYNGGAFPPEINLYSNPYGKTSLLVTDAANVKIIFKEGSVKPQLEGDGSACFGENNRIVYYACSKNSVYLRIYKILLGMGDNNLSDITVDKSNSNNWGTFIAGKAETDYNGTAQILGYHDGYVGAETQPQGMAYDGFLYIGTGFTDNHAYKIQLKDDNTFNVVDDYRYVATNYKNEKTHIEPEATFIIDGVLYLGGRGGSPNMVKFRL